MKVTQAEVQACTEKKELIDLYVNKLSLKDMKELLNVMQYESGLLFTI